MSSDLRIVFMGTPDFAAPSLRALCENGYEIAGVFCQPDRPQGRKMQLTPCSVKVEAQKLRLNVFQFEKIRKQEGLDALRALKPDLCVTAAYGQILSDKNLAVPPLGTVNVHASLLPKYRGAAPIQWAVINGEAKTGITTMYTAKGIDTGDIILQEETPIQPQETAGELFERLALLGAQTLIKTVRLIEAGKAPRVPQNESEATHCTMIDKEMALIDFSKPAQAVVNLIRGMNPWPVAYAYLNGETMKIYSAQAVSGHGAPGQVLAANPSEGFVVACVDGAIKINALQMPGGKTVSAQDYLRGHKIEPGILLGGKNGQ